MTMKIGEAKFESKKKVHKLEGDKTLAHGVFRILPALGSLADSGRYFMKYEVEWGYKDSDGISRPFLNCRQLDFDNPTTDSEGKKIFPVKVESAAYLKRQDLRAGKAQAIKDFKDKKISKDELMKIVENCDRYNLDIKYYYNAINLNGEIGLLKLNTSFHKSLKAAISKYRDENNGANPLGINNGIFFQFRRTNETGKLQDYVFEVAPYYVDVQIDGRMFKDVKRHNIDESVMGRLGDEAYDLGDMYKSVTSEETELIVHGGVEGVEKVLGRARGLNSEASAVKSKAVSETATPMEQKPKQNVEASVSDMKASEEMKPVNSSEEMSDEDFLDSIELG